MPRLIDYPRAKRRGPRRFIPSWKLVFGTFSLGATFAALIFGFLVLTTDIPAPNEISQARATVVLYADGKSEVGRIGEYNRVEVDLVQIPIHTQRAVLALEDQGFYEHSGFSVTGIARAIINNLAGGEEQGASTITQQYTKNAYLTSERTWVRKIKELVLAVKLETSSSKDEILQNYLNTVYFGRGAYGIEAAARVYFNISVEDLNVAQSLMLASLLKSPEGFAPEVNPARLQQRWVYGANQMLDLGWINQRERDQLVFPDVKPRATGNRLSGTKGYILREVTKFLESQGYDESTLGISGLTVTTTLNRKSQNAAVNAVNQAGPKSNLEGVRIGLVALKPGTGEIVAMYGGPDYVTEPLNNVTQAITQAGSTFKVYGLISAIESGYSLDHILPGKSGIEISGYKVNNYGGKNYRNLTLLQATMSSVNTAYVQLAYEVGISNVIEAAYRTGLARETLGVEENLTFVLGSASPRVIDVAESYATLAGNGVHAEPYLVKRVTLPNGGLFYEAEVEANEMFDPNVIASVNFALQNAVEGGTGTSARVSGYDIAGKTGTTDDNKSAWFAGYSNSLTAVVMLMKQDANGNPISLNGTGGLGSVTGGSFPARIFAAFMKAALSEFPSTPFIEPTATPSITATPTESPTSSQTAEPSPTPTATP
jgi:membrane peptidoglycan carboxypeptidase